MRRAKRPIAHRWPRRRGGREVLDKGGSSLDAVEAAIRILEDDPLFNAGRGADFTADGRNELDAAIMDGSSMKAGAVAEVTRTRHPISLARAVMEKSPHVILVGQGADEFSAYAGLEQVDPSYFFTERRWQSLIKQLKRKACRFRLDLPARHRRLPAAPRCKSTNRPDTHRYGTVGVVALDRSGNLAAGTSTGGLQCKMPGPRRRLAHHRRGHLRLKSILRRLRHRNRRVLHPPDVRARSAPCRYKGMTLQQAADQVIHQELERFTATAASSPSLPTANWPGASTLPACFAPATRRRQGGNRHLQR